MSDLKESARTWLPAAGRWLMSAGGTLARWTLALLREGLVNIAAASTWAANKCSAAVARLDARRN